MSGDEMNQLETQTLDARIQQELEHVPDLSVAIPADFAARVAAKVPEKRVIRATRATHYGRKLMWASLVVLLIVLIALAGQSFVHSTVGIAIEWTLCVQFLAIVVWLGVRHWRES